MKVTIAIPCYNGEQYVGSAIEATLRQSRPPDEILVIDDGSTDHSAEIIRHYPVRLVRHAYNQGLASARNTAIEAATGEIIVFIDVDAFAAPDMLTSLLKHYDDPEVAGVGGQGIESNIHSVADRWRKAHASQGYGSYVKDVEFLFGLCMSFRTEVLRKEGGFNTAFRTNAEDMEIGLRLTRAGYRLRYEPAAKVYHQRRDDLSSLKRTMVKWFTAAYYARKLNHAQPWRMLAGTLKRMFTDPVEDILNDISLLPLSFLIHYTKFFALSQFPFTFTEEEP